MCLIRNDQIFTKSNDSLNGAFYEALSQDEQSKNVNLDSGDNDNPSNIPQIPNIEVSFQGVKNPIDGLDARA